MSVLPGRGTAPLLLLFLFFTVLKGSSFHQHGKFFLTQIEGLRSEDVIYCTDCKAHTTNMTEGVTGVNRA